MRLTDHTNSKKQGDAGLGIAIGWFARNGHTVSVPLTDSQDYDLVVDMADKLARVQVKTTTYRDRHNRYSVTLRVAGGNRSGTGKQKKLDLSRVEYVFAVTSDDTMYLIPTSAMTCRSQLCLTGKYDKFRVT